MADVASGVTPGVAGGPLPDLEVACDHCNGEGELGSHAGDVRCHKCGGAGHIPTEFGLRILALVRHNLRIGRADVDWR
jgi:DnaJ-class molecular chaperone